MNVADHRLSQNALLAVVLLVGPLAAAEAATSPATQPSLAGDREERASGRESTARLAGGTEFIIVAQPDTYTITEKVPERRETAGFRRLAGPTLELAPHRSTEALLRLTPNLLVVQHGAEGKGCQFFLRGFDAVHGSDLEVLVEGIPINEVSNVHGQGYVDLGFVPAELVEEMVVRKGPFVLDQGDFAMAGSVGLFLGVSEPGSRLSYEAGSTNRHRLLFVESPASWRHGFVAVEALTDDGFGDDRSSRKALLLVKAPLSLPASVSSLLFAAHKGFFGSPTTVRVDDIESGRMPLRGSYVHGLTGETTRLLAAFTSRTATAQGTLDVLLGVQGRGFDLESNYTGFLLYDRGDSRRQRHTALTGFARAWWSRAWHMGPMVLGGRVGVLWRGDRFSQDEGLIDGHGELPRLVTRDAWGQEHHITLAVGTEVFWARRIAGSVGVRMDTFDFHVTDRLQSDRRYDASLPVLTPRAALQVLLARGLTLFSSYGRGIRSPEARSLITRDLPNEDVPLSLYQGGMPTVAQADAVEAGLRLSRANFGLTMSAFATFLSNETVFDHVSSTNLELNATRRVGAELGVQYRPRSWLEMRGETTFVDARFVQSGNPVPGAPQFLGTGHLTLMLPYRLRGSVSAFVLAPRKLAHGAVGTWQAWADLTLAYRFNNIEMRLEVENLTNADLREGEYHFASWTDTSQPRSFIPVTHVVAVPPRLVRLMVTLYSQLTGTEKTHAAIHNKSPFLSGTPAPPCRVRLSRRACPR